MAVYVDTARNPLGRMLMSHMLADSLPELHAMADIIGVDRSHFQDLPDKPHYDICQAKRALAIEAGAQVIDRRGVVLLLRRLRAGSGGR